MTTENKDQEKLMCMGCDTEVAFFRLTYVDYDGTPEIYCPDCMGNIVKDCPEDIELIEVISLLNKTKYNEVLKTVEKYKEILEAI